MEFTVVSAPTPRQLIRKPAENEIVELEFEVNVTPVMDSAMDVILLFKNDKQLTHKLDDLERNFYLNPSTEKFELKKKFRLSIHSNKKKVISTISFQIVWEGQTYDLDLVIPVVFYDHQSTVDLAGAFADAAYLFKEVISFEDAVRLAVHWLYFNQPDTSKKTVTKKRKPGEEQGEMPPEILEDILRPLTSENMELLLRKVVVTFDREAGKAKFPKRPEFKRFLFALSRLSEYIANNQVIFLLWKEGSIIVSDEKTIENLLVGKPMGTFCLKLSNSFFALWARESSDRKALEVAEESMGPFVVPLFNGTEIEYWNPPFKMLKSRNLVDIVLSNISCTQFISIDRKMHDRSFISKEPPLRNEKSNLNNARYVHTTVPVQSSPASAYSSNPNSPLTTVMEVNETIISQYLSMDTGASSPIPVEATTSTRPSIESVLSKLGLNKYIPVFQQEALDVDVLKMMPKEELSSEFRKLGLKLGEIVKIQNELSKM